MTLIERLAQFTVDTRFEDLPREVIAETKRTLLDSIGCALAGVTSEKGKLGIELARRMGGSGESTVIGVGDKISSFAAAFANGELINGFDHDAILQPPGHVSPYVIPPLLAWGEQKRASGKDLILAAAIAHEISTRVGKALSGVRDITDEVLKTGRMEVTPVRGYSCCIFGGVAGVGKILGLDEAKLSHALGLAGHIAPVQSLGKWNKTVPLAMTKYLLAGWMCQAALAAASMADIGYKGDKSILEGEFGFWRFAGSSKWDANTLMEKLGQDWLFPSSTELKPYACARIIHGGLDCLIHIIETNHLEPGEIEKVSAFIEAFCMQPAWMNRQIQSQVDAQISVAYNLSVAAHRIRIGPEWQDIEVMRDPRILSFMDKVTFEPHPDYIRTLMKEPHAKLAKVEVKARGKLFTEERKYPKGSQCVESTKMTDQELVDKFKHNASRILPWHKMDSAVRCLLELEDVPDSTELLNELSL